MKDPSIIGTYVPHVLITTNACNWPVSYLLWFKLIISVQFTHGENRYAVKKKKNQTFICYWDDLRKSQGTYTRQTRIPFKYVQVVVCASTMLCKLCVQYQKALLGKAQGKALQSRHFIQGSHRSVDGLRLNPGGSQSKVLRESKILHVLFFLKVCFTLAGLLVSCFSPLLNVYRNCWSPCF